MGNRWLCRTKRISIALALLVLLSALCGCSGTMETEASPVKEADQYQREIDTLRQEIADKESEEVSQDPGQPTLVYGYCVEYFWEYPWSDESGTIVLTPASLSDWDLINLVTNYDRTVLLMLDEFNPLDIEAAQAVLPIDGVVLKGEADSVENRQALVDMGIMLQSVSVDSLNCGVQDNGALNIPFSYVESDDAGITEDLSNLLDGQYTLLLIFEPEMTISYNTCRHYVEKGYFTHETLPQAQERLLRVHEEQMAAQREAEAYIARREERIEELRETIAALYAGK